jgi:ribosomal protein S18 acetylase RimI-like enzyme
MEIRLAHADEYDRVADILTEAYAPGGLRAGDAYWGHLRDVSRRATTAEVWVAAEDQTVLGTVTWPPPGSPQRELAADGEAEFRMLGVARPARRRGVAEALVVRCIERARELGYHGLVLSSMAEMAAAHRLYHRLGFRRDSGRDWSPVPGVELLAFRLDLGETPAHR